MCWPSCDDAGFIERRCLVHGCAASRWAGSVPGTGAGQNHPFAADGEVRREFSRKFGVRYLAFDKRKAWCWTMRIAGFEYLKAITRVSNCQ
jgi:hypothetical protein